MKTGVDVSGRYHCYTSSITHAVQDEVPMTACHLDNTCMVLRVSMYITCTKLYEFKFSTL